MYLFVLGAGEFRLRDIKLMRNRDERKKQTNSSKAVSQPKNFYDYKKKHSRKRRNVMVKFFLFFNLELHGWRWVRFREILNALWLLLFLIDFSGFVLRVVRLEL